jgi:hypothetical protein
MKSRKLPSDNDNPVLAVAMAHPNRPGLALRAHLRKQHMHLDPDFSMLVDVHSSCEST